MVPDVRIVFELDGKRRELNYKKLPLSAWSELKQSTGLSPKTLLDAMGEFDVEAIAGVIWLERKQRERRLNYAQAYQDLSDQWGETEWELIDYTVEGRSVLGPEVANGEAVEEDPPTETE